MSQTPRPLFQIVIKVWIITLLFLFGCAAQTIETKPREKFAEEKIELPFATPEIIRLHEANLAKEYLIGPGDRLQIEVWDRPELSEEHLVGPYGNITLPIIGEYKIGGETRSSATKSIQSLYAKLYEDPVVTVRILAYMNHKIYVLGRVSNPGVIHLDGEATILEALSMAGGLPTQDKTVFLSKCYVIRGREQIIWIDLLQLLERANLNLNIRLANNDIIYIPDSLDASVFVMGEVRNPGSYPIQSSGLSFLDAISLAGGPTENANMKKIRLVRDLKEQEDSDVIDLDRLISMGDFSQNHILKDNDIIYVPKKGIAKFNYYLRQIDPFMRTFITGALIQDELNN